MVLAQASLTANEAVEKEPQEIALQNVVGALELPPGVVKAAVSASPNKPCDLLLRLHTDHAHHANYFPSSRNQLPDRSIDPALIACAAYLPNRPGAPPNHLLGYSAIAPPSAAAAARTLMASRTAG